WLNTLPATDPNREYLDAHKGNVFKVDSGWYAKVCKKFIQRFTFILFQIPKKCGANGRGGSV
ncbi:hypothetical protein A2U01_0091962, partial [Trifolium medium]|nr:hypothetical protein [Trifolium medium]